MACRVNHQEGCKNFKGAHPNKECPLHEEAKNIEEVKKFQESTETYKKGHDEIIRNLASKVKALTGEVEGRAIRTKIGEYKVIFTKEGLPLYTPFYYSPKEIKYFFANSSFSDEDVQEKAKEVVEIEKVAAHHEPAHQKVTPSDLPIVSYYVAPYEPSILFLRHLEQHAEEALIHYAMESLKRVKATRKAKTINGEAQSQALVDGKKVVINESTIRRDFQLEDVEGVDFLPNVAIFE
nr:hypothetical protein [Tanacetum cinerariifolium]